MPSPSGRPAYRNPGWFLVLPAVVLAGVLGWAARRGGADREGPRRVLVVALPLEEAPLPPGELPVLANLVKDLLETQGGRAVSLAPAPPAPEDLGGGAPAVLLTFRAGRQGAALRLRAAIRRLDGPAGAELPGPVASPAEALAWLVGRLPGPPVRPDQEGRLVPRAPEAFWALLEGGAVLEDPGRAEEVMGQVRACEALAPDCASAALLRAQCLAYRAVEDPLAPPGALDQAREAFEEVLRRLPDHPRGSYLLAKLLMDAGRPREALQRTLNLRRAYPEAGPGYQALAYVGRNAGLLGLAAQGYRGLEEITVDRRHPYRMKAGLLYLGEWEAFERSLWLTPGDPYDAVLRFHLGYLEVLRGRRPQALAHFRALRALPGGAYPRYRALGEVFRLGLEGRTLEAMKGLSDLDRELEGLRAPDGEFTFNLAEAYAFLGNRDLAMDLAGRAFAQGFACTRWYRESPLMASLQGLPRWEALLQALRERQARLEAQVPAVAPAP